MFVTVLQELNLYIQCLNTPLCHTKGNKKSCLNMTSTGLTGICKSKLHINDDSSYYIQYKKHQVYSDIQKQKGHKGKALGTKMLANLFVHNKYNKKTANDLFNQ